MEFGYKINCPNKRRKSFDPKKKCGWPLLFVDKFIKDTEMLIECKSCNAQVMLIFNKFGNLSLKVNNTKAYVKYKPYPYIAEGAYKKKGLKAWQA